MDSSTDQSTLECTINASAVDDVEVGEERNLTNPLAIVADQINAIVSNLDDENDCETISEVNYNLAKQGFKVKETSDFGGDVEIVQSDAQPSASCAPSSGSKFRKGHRRAWSMPNANRDKNILIVTDDKVNDDGNQRHHIIRYRLCPYDANDTRTNDAINEFIQGSNFDMEIPFDDTLPIDGDQYCFPGILGIGQATDRTRAAMRRIWEATWKAQHFDLLPPWLQDNEYLHRGHRPPIPSFTSCFQSIFKLHTETGNIWTHLYGCLAFVAVAMYFCLRPSWQVTWTDKIIFSFFFFGAICCLGLSCSFHTVQCHSIGVGKLFSKLDYSGITMLIIGSFIPWIYYGFYCRMLPMIVYMSMITFLGIAALIVSLFDRFGSPAYRPVRAGVFVAMGLSSLFPAAHMLVIDGLQFMFDKAFLHWLLLMGAFYLIGAAVYAFRFPERLFPGKCDYFCQSHQLFHIFVVFAALIHFHGMCQMAMTRLEEGSCQEQMIARFGVDTPNIVDDYLRPY